MALPYKAKIDIDLFTDGATIHYLTALQNKMHTDDFHLQLTQDIYKPLIVQWFFHECILYPTAKPGLIMNVDHEKRYSLNCSRLITNDNHHIVPL